MTRRMEMMMDTKWEARGLTIWEPGQTALSIAVVTQHQKKAKQYAHCIAAAPELLEVASAPRITKAGKTLYLGFQDEGGCWSVAIPEEMVGFVERWDAKRNAAIAKAEGQ